VLSHWLAAGIARLGVEDVRVMGELGDPSSPRPPRSDEQLLQVAG
jgi:hypothetical protein